MKATELNREQLVCLKERYLCDWYDSVGDTPSWEELANVDEFVEDETVFDYFEGIEFVPEDFPEGIQKKQLTLQA